MLVVVWWQQPRGLLSLLVLVLRLLRLPRLAAGVVAVEVGEEEEEEEEEEVEVEVERVVVVVVAPSRGPRVEMIYLSGYRVRWGCMEVAVMQLAEVPRNIYRQEVEIRHSYHM